MPNKNIFCNVPWFHLQIESNGDFSYCCSSNYHGYAKEKDHPYNIKRMSIAEWYNSQPMTSIRKQILRNSPLTGCNTCYKDEKFGNESYRLANNWRSIIFTKFAFEPSYEQSPHNAIFESSIGDGIYSGMPVDLHVDLGTECNLACKFCSPTVSSKVASNYKVWGLMDKSIPSIIDWSRDQEVWVRFCNELLKIKNLRSVHFMGGEPTMNPRLEQFLDFFIKEEKTNFAVSFVTNGTRYIPTLIEKMKKFSRADIDISIESVLENNYYIRQGLKKDQYLNNIKSFLSHRSENFQICLKPVISLLQAPTFPELITYFLENDIVTESNTCSNPAYLSINVLPFDLRQQYLPKFEKTLARLDEVISNYNRNTEIVMSRVTNLNAINLRSELTLVYNMLKMPDPDNADALRKELVYWLSKWDTIYNQDARDYYPEWTDFLNQYDYKKIPH